jgi:hypothetical protein
MPNLCYLLLAQFIFLNLMIAVGVTVFSETKSDWRALSLEVKNEFIIHVECLMICNL